MTSPSAAAGAYASLARLANPSSNPSAGLGRSIGEANGGPSFGELLRNTISGVVEAGRKADTQAHAMAAGKANVVDVVTAVAETEVAVETMVAVRDRVIAAYEEIMRMPI
jgi:flagellar hook-basal body complex protein FliE